MECGENWAGGSVCSYFRHRDFRLSLGDLSTDTHTTGKHSVLKMAKKIATGSMIGSFRLAAWRKWRLNLELGREVKRDGSFPDNTGCWELVEVGPHLSSYLLQVMQRGGDESVGKAQ